MPETSVAVRNDEQVVRSREETRASERYIKPAVDIIESGDGLTMFADLPGVTKESLDINVDKGVLTLNAPALSIMPGRPIYSEFVSGHYYRQFTIPETLDHGKANANLSNGVLNLYVPLAETAKPRKIEIKAS